MSSIQYSSSFGDRANRGPILIDPPPTLARTSAQSTPHQGQLYLSRSGVAEREAVRQIGIDANSSDVVVLEICQEINGEHLLPENIEFCERRKQEYAGEGYADLMNTTFALIPAGRSPATYRLGEALSAGAIPVFVHEAYVKPFPDRIPWRLCSLSFPVEEAASIIERLRAIPEQKLMAMQVRGRARKGTTC